MTPAGGPPAPPPGAAQRLAWRPLFRAAATAFCLLLASAVPARAGDAFLTDFQVSEKGDYLLLNFRVVGAFNQKLEEAIQNGVPATFSFFITLDRKRAVLPDNVSDLTLTHTLKYHVLKNQYIVKRSWEEGKTLSTDSLSEAQGWMTEIKGLKLARLKNLEDGRHYEIKAKAELEKVDLPLFLNFVFFTFLWDFETKWHSYEFIHPPSSR